MSTNYWLSASLLYVYIQLDELGHAIDKAAMNPVKFHLTSSELEKRQGWLNNTRKQVWPGWTDMNQKE